MESEKTEIPKFHLSKADMDDNLCLEGWESPIKLIWEAAGKRIGEEIDKGVFESITKCGIEVDKDEIIKAMKYDREQYSKGYSNGFIAGENYASMFTLEQIDILSSAIQKYGEDEQSVVAIEEMSELTKELTKMYRGTGSVVSITEELADVLIMCKQIEMIYCDSDILEHEISRKINRLKERLNGK